MLHMIAYYRNMIDGKFIILIRRWDNNDKNTTRFGNVLQQCIDTS